VYVYELPGRFNTDLMEGRIKTADCMYRDYTPGNATRWLYSAFGMETALHEILLTSPHRTLDPETADFFFVPVYGGCYISRFFRPTPGHSLFLHDTWLPAPVRGSHFYLEALRWISTHFPYWDRRNGSDHLFAFPHDEGACAAPVEVGSRAILLSSWGRIGHVTNSTTIMPESIWRWPGFVNEMYGASTCFDPAKDILMPVFTPVPVLAEAAALQPALQQLPAAAAAAAAATTTTNSASTSTATAEAVATFLPPNLRNQLWISELGLM
jgi:hypothetical protein